MDSAPLPPAAPPPPLIPPPHPGETPPAAPEGEGADPLRPPRRALFRGRTAVLIACAALLGTVAGVATGYTVQADRDPTPLPPLSQPELGYPAKPLPEGEEPEPIPAKHDRRVRTDGDLRKLLLEKPKGAQEPEALFPEDGWTSLTEYARIYEQPGSMFQDLISADFRRSAVATWREGANRGVSIHLVQFHDYTSHSAMDHAKEHLNALAYARISGTRIEGTGYGRYFVHDGLLPGAGPRYSANAITRRGDIMMDIWISDSEPISEKAIRDLAERQLERL